MRKTVTRLLALMLAVLLLAPMMAPTYAAESDTYDEVIIMVDASTSQARNFATLKSLILEVGGVVLSDGSNTRLTLMGFGVGPKHAGTFTNLAELEAFLSTATQADFLQERSATNCEVGFDYVNNYINNSPNLNRAYVIYTSDGAANLDETKLDWSQWQNTEVFDYFGSYTTDAIQDYIIDVELGHIDDGGYPLDATWNLSLSSRIHAGGALTWRGLNIRLYQRAMNNLANALQSKSEQYVTDLLQDIFQYANLSWNEPQSASVVEKAFQTYFQKYANDEFYDAYMDLFYLILGDTGRHMAGRYDNAKRASIELQANPKVLCVTHAGYSGASNTWMNPEKSAYDDVSKLRYVYEPTLADLIAPLTAATAAVMELF